MVGNYAARFGIVTRIGFSDISALLSFQVEVSFSLWERKLGPCR